MSFTNFGIAKGLSVVPDWNRMIEQDQNRFAQENQFERQKRADVEAEAAKMELGTTYDAYNEGRYNKFVKDKFKQISDFHTENPNYQYDTEAMMKYNAMLKEIKDNPIIRESLTTKEETQKLNDFIAKNPGAENLPEIKEQLQHLTKVLAEGHTENGQSQPFRFKAPQTRNIFDEISKLTEKAGVEKIVHKNGMFYTETNLDPAKVESLASQYLLDPMSAALAKQAFENQDPLMQEMDQSPKMMIARLMKANYTPKITDPKQWNYDVANGRTTKTPKDNSYATFNYYKSDVINNAHVKGNPMLKALADGVMSYDANGYGKYYVNHVDAQGFPVVAYVKPDGKYGALRVKSQVEIVDGNELIGMSTNGGKTITNLVKGTARWEEKYDGTAKGMEAMVAQYAQVPNARIVKNDGAGTVVWETPAMFTPHNNATRYNQTVASMWPTALPQGVIEENGGVPSKVKNSSLNKGANNSAQEVEITSGAVPANAVDLGGGIYFDASTNQYYKK